MILPYIKVVICFFVTTVTLNILLYFYVDKIQCSCRKKQIEMKLTVHTETVRKNKTILLWTKWYRREWYDFPDGYGNQIFRTCPVSNCWVTNDRSQFNRSDAVVFHTQPKDFIAFGLPKYRFPHQRFIMYFFEPLMYSSRAVFNSAPAHFFNWTFTFRRFSDVASVQYGTYEFIPESMERKLAAIPDSEESLDNFYGVNITGKSVMVAWFNSHCPTPILREDYATELAKYVRVDVYGKCGNFTCGGRYYNQDNRPCDQLLANDYLFYLSFENSFCPDYVTEKLFRPLRDGAVPIVFGGAHYTRFAPPHSFINALDFESPKQLADYLITLEANRKLYAHYFEWRRHFRVPERTNSDWCQLCAMLNDESLPSKSYANISQWWFDDHPCQDFQWKLNTSTQL